MISLPLLELSGQDHRSSLTDTGDSSSVTRKNRPRRGLEKKKEPGDGVAGL
jgi:hypothetical protein